MRLARRATFYFTGNDGDSTALKDTDSTALEEACKARGISHD